MQPDAPALLWDALKAIELVERFTHDKSFEDYRSDDLLKSAVERQLEILGEALNRLSKVDPPIAAEILDLPRIVAFRNILVHGYASVDDNLVWQVVKDRLPSLADLIRTLAG
jgi:uncharacterized protein with HEPN domain